MVNVAFVGIFLESNWQIPAYIEPQFAACSTEEILDAPDTFALFFSKVYRLFYPITYPSEILTKIGIRQPNTLTDSLRHRPLSLGRRQYGILYLHQRPRYHSTLSSSNPHGRPEFGEGDDSHAGDFLLDCGR